MVQPQTKHISNPYNLTAHWEPYCLSDHLAETPMKRLPHLVIIGSFFTFPHILNDLLDDRDKLVRELVGVLSRSHPIVGH